MSSLDAASDSNSSPSGERLPPALGRWTAAMVVIGATIGSGVFIMPNAVARATGGYVGLILLLWTLCGLVNLCGALTLAELGAMMPRAGGTYVYLREAYGRLWAFLWGWTELWVIRSGSIAALAAGMMISTRFVVKDVWNYDLSRHESGLFAVAAIAALTVVNVIGVRWGGFVQSGTTVLKIGFVAAVALLPFVFPSSRATPVDPWWPPALDGNVLLGSGAALAAIMWAYDGWGNVGVIAEEIRDPQRSIPWALTFGVVLLVVLYVAVNLAYHLTLPSQTIAESPAPAVTVAATYFPSFGGPAMNAVLMLSMFGALNANVLAGPRVLFAMARDGAFLPAFASIHPATKTPAVAVAALSIWSCLLILLATYAPDLQAALIARGLLAGELLPADKPLFEVLTNYCVFGGSVFYFTTVAAVFVLRKTRPDAPRPYRTWGYPITPAVFLVFYVGFLAAMFYNSLAESSLGLLFIALGVLMQPRAPATVAEPAPSVV